MDIISRYPAAIPPISRSDLKQQARIVNSFTEDDATLDRIINAVIDYCEKETNTAIWLSNTRQYFSPFQYILLDPPVRAIVSVKYYDDNGDEQTMPKSEYTVNRLGGFCVQIMPKSKQYLYHTWVDFIVGYGEFSPDQSFDGVTIEAGTLEPPASIVQALLLLGEYWYRHRSAGENFNPNPIDHGLSDILDLIRNYY